jgi:cathepsin L
MPDIGVTGTPDPTIATPYDAIAWGWADADNVGNPGAQKIKEAVCEYGAVASWVDAGGTFGAYTTGIYDDNDDQLAGFQSAGHYVAIIGWDDVNGAWLIKNSWGQDWGNTAGFGRQRGYGWITYGTHSIGTWVSWVRAKGLGYTLPKRYYQLLPKKRIPAERIKTQP